MESNTAPVLVKDRKFFRSVGVLGSVWDQVELIAQRDHTTTTAAVERLIVLGLEADRREQAENRRGQA